MSTPTDPALVITMAQRAHGEGSVYQRQDNRWVAYLRLPDGRKKFLYASSKREAREKLAAASQAQKQGLLATGPRQTVAQYLQTWLEDTVATTVRPKTYEGYEMNVRCRIIPVIGRIMLDALTPEHVQSIHAAILKKGLSKHSVVQAHTILHGALRQAVRWGLIVRNPCEAVTVPRPERREMTVLDEAGLRKLFEVTRDHPWHPLWVLLATSGLRIGEALGLTWKDIDLDAGQLVVRHALQRQRGHGLLLVEPKTRRSRRSVPLSEGTVDVLRQHRRRQAEAELNVGPLWQKRDMVFCDAFGKPAHGSSLGEVLRDALTAADLPRMRIHDLRHTAATHLLSRGIHPKIVQELLGHSTIALTLDTYSHVSPTMTREAANAMESLFRATGG
jgi:integrase